MANEFIIKKGLISKANSIVSGSLIVTEGVSGSFSGSFEGDGSGLTNVPTTTTASYALTASYVETSQTASYVETAQTASYVISSSIEGITNYVRNDQTSSMTVATASYVETAQTASYVLNAVSSSYSSFAISASYAVSASHEIIKEVSSSYADTASFAQSGDGIFSGSFSGSFEGYGGDLTGISFSTDLTQSIFVTQNGNDSTAVIGNLLRPFATLESASLAATTGSTIFVYPGTYTVEANYNLAKPGVDYYFYPNTTISKSTAGDMFDITGFTDGMNVYGNADFILGSSAGSLWEGYAGFSYTFQARDIISNNSNAIVNGYSNNSTDIASWEFRLMSASNGNAFYHFSPSSTGLLNIDCDRIIASGYCIGTGNGSHSGKVIAKRLESTGTYAFTGYPNQDGWTFLVDEAVGVGPMTFGNHGAYRCLLGNNSSNTIIGNASGILCGSGAGGGGLLGNISHTGKTKYLEGDSMNLGTKYQGGIVEFARNDSSGILDFNWAPKNAGTGTPNTGEIIQTNGIIYANCNAYTPFSCLIDISGGTFVGTGILGNQYPYSTDQINISGGTFIWKGIYNVYQNIPTNYGSTRYAVNLTGGVCKIEGTINMDGSNFTTNLPSHIIKYNGGKLILDGATLTTVDTTQPTPAIFPDQDRDVYIYSGGVNYNQTGSNALINASGSGFTLTNVLGGMIIEDSSVE